MPMQYNNKITKETSKRHRNREIGSLHV